MADDKRNLRSLISNPHESMEIEIKDWLDLENKSQQADLAQAMLAHANSGGGYILIGFKEIGSEFKPSISDENITCQYNQDRINGIVKKYADPQFHIECQIVDGFPIIVVPGSHNTPIRCMKDGPDGKHVKMNAYYIRRPGPSSEVVQTGKEWQDLIRRCLLSENDKLLEQIKMLLRPDMISVETDKNDDTKHKEWIEIGKRRFNEKITESFSDISKSPYSKGYWMASYSLRPEKQAIKLGDLLVQMRKCVGSETGWPIGLFPYRHNPYPYDGNLEVWLADSENVDTSSADFWIAAPGGKFVTFRGHQEDSGSLDQAQSKYLDLLLPIWRTGELLLHAKRFVDQFEDTDVSLDVSCSWTGLARRQLKGRFEYYIADYYVSQQDIVNSFISIEKGVSIDTMLPELVAELTAPLYEAFSLFTLPKSTIEKELNRMRGIK